jgi:hypothetical protein
LESGPPHRHTLALPARELGRPAVELVGELQQLGDLRDAAVELGLGGLGQPERIADVLAHRHVGVERVALEHHGDVAVLGREVGDVAAADGDGAGGHLLEPGDHAEQRGLAAARRPDQHQQLAVGDVEVDGVDGRDRAVVDLGGVADGDVSHGGSS